MPEVTIPFNDWSRQRIEKGIKTATTRYKKYGEPGDYFISNGVVYRIIQVIRTNIGFVAANYFFEEGALSHEDFVSVWAHIHPGRGFRPDDLVWYHLFERVSP
jgi:hypothetical protein